MGSSGFSVRPARSSDEVQELWWPQMQELGWNRWHGDMQTHWASSKGGFLVLTHKNAGDKVVGVTLPVIFTNQTGWVGFFILDAEYRGFGGGAALFQAGADLLKAQGVEHVGLDAVEQQVPTYGRRGYVEAGRVKLLIHKPYTEKAPPAEEDVGAKLTLPDRIVDIKQVKPADLVRYDKECSGLERTALWTEEALFSRPDFFGFAIEGKDQQVLGVVVVRSCQHGYRVGPLYASTKSYCESLLYKVMAHIESLGAEAKTKQMIAEVWGENPDAAAAFEELGWEWCGVDYRRMWLNGKVPECQQKGGKAEREAFAWFDAGEG